MGSLVCDASTFGSGGLMSGVGGLLVGLGTAVESLSLCPPFAMSAFLLVLHVKSNNISK